MDSTAFICSSPISVGTIPSGISFHHLSVTLIFSLLIDLFGVSSLDNNLIPFILGDNLAGNINGFSPLTYDIYLFANFSNLARDSTFGLSLLNSLITLSFSLYVPSFICNNDINQIISSGSSNIGVADNNNNRFVPLLDFSKSVIGPTIFFSFVSPMRILCASSIINVLFVKILANSPGCVCKSRIILANSVSLKK